MGTLFDTLEAKGDPSEIVCVHRSSLPFTNLASYTYRQGSQEAAANWRQFGLEAAFGSPLKLPYTDLGNGVAEPTGG